jgi:FkbM family methyltransferase
MINLFLKYTFGRMAFLPIYQKLYSLALRGLNYGMVGSGEEYVMKYLKESLPSDKSLTFFDVGANIGTYAKLLLKYFNSNANILVFEPSKSTFVLLKDNLKNEKVALFNIGFGSVNDTIKLFKNEENSTLASAFQREVEKTKFVDFEDVIIETLDTFCERTKIDFIDFIKIDTEGFEKDILTGASNMLKNRKIRIIQFEFGGTQIEPRNFFRDYWDILSPNYTIFRIMNDGLLELKDYNERLEVFIYSNFLAVSR